MQEFVTELGDRKMMSEFFHQLMTRSDQGNTNRRSIAMD